MDFFGARSIAWVGKKWISSSMRRNKGKVPPLPSGNDQAEEGGGTAVSFFRLSRVRQRKGGKKGGEGIFFPDVFSVRKKERRMLLALSRVAATWGRGGKGRDKGGSFFVIFPLQGAGGRKKGGRGIVRIVGEKEG